MEIINWYCIESNTDISKYQRLEILLHPKDQVNCKPGNRIEFSILATSKATCFQWYFQESIIDAENSDYAGATEKILIILECLSVHQGQYKCIVTDESGQMSVESRAAILMLGMSFAYILLRGL